MHNRLVAAVLLALVTGCTGNTDTGNSQPENSTADTSDTNEWSLSRETTGMDGEVVSASRTYPFANDTNFVAEIVCGRSKSSLSLKIQSLVGDAENPAESSAFVLDRGFNQAVNQAANGQSDFPVVRVKIGNREPIDSNVFAPYFVLGDYSNQLKYSGSSLAQDIPMIVEVKNGTGTYQLDVDASNEVMQVLSACGKQVTASGQPATIQSSSGADPGMIETAGVPSSNASDAANAEDAANAAAAANASSSLPISPSFDCTRAETDVEQAICDDAILSKLDASMAANYSAMLASNLGEGARDELKLTQRGWMKSRDHCADRDCLESSYRDRLDAICDYPVISGVHPVCTTSQDIE